MPDKQEVLDSVANRKYDSSEVKHLINSVKTASTYADLMKTDKIRVGDVFIAQGGYKRRPYVVISVRTKANLAISVPLTTTNDELALTPYTSRFLKGGWFTNQLVTVKLDFVKDNFAGIIENRAVIRQFKRDLKQFYKGLL